MRPAALLRLLSAAWVLAACEGSAPGGDGPIADSGFRFAEVSGPRTRGDDTLAEPAPEDGPVEPDAEVGPEIEEVAEPGDGGTEVGRDGVPETAGDAAPPDDGSAIEPVDAPEISDVEGAGEPDSAPDGGGDGDPGTAEVAGGDAAPPPCKLGDPASCDDGDPCTQDFCGLDGLCFHTLEKGMCHVGGACFDHGEMPDGDLCHVCDLQKSLSSLVPVACDDGNPCTEDICLGAVGCWSPPNDDAKCDDGLPCSTDDHCEGGACVGSSCECTSNQECVALYAPGPCELAVCVLGNCQVGADGGKEGTSCDDGDPCTTGFTCKGAFCGVPKDCSKLGDGSCSFGVCDSDAGGCVAVVFDDGTPCDGGDPCTVDDVCKEGVCTDGVSPCDDGDLCNGVEGCIPDEGCFSLPAPDCSDGKACNGLEACDAEEGCLAGKPLSCDDGNPCNGKEGCDDATGCTPGVSAACNDGDPCNGFESCHPELGCVQGPPPQCDDGDACNGIESCAPNEGCKPSSAPLCGAFACEPGGCKTSCADAGDCAPGYWCHAGTAQCFVQGNPGEPCTKDDDSQCATGYCDNGYCCEGGTCCASTEDCPVTDNEVKASQPFTCYPGFNCTESYWFGVFDEAEHHAQSFVVYGSGALSKVRVTVWGDVDAPLMKLSLHVGGLPGKGSSIELGSAVFDYPRTPETGIPYPPTEVVLDPAPQLEQGFTYYLVLEYAGPCDPASGKCGAPLVSWGGTENAGAYPPGQAWTFKPQGGWGPHVQQGDFTFEVFVGTAACVNGQCLGTE